MAILPWSSARRTRPVDTFVRVDALALFDDGRGLAGGELGRKGDADVLGLAQLNAGLALDRAHAFVGDGDGVGAVRHAREVEAAFLVGGGGALADHGVAF